MQKLDVFQSLWGMELKHPTLPECSHEENFAMAAEAGFAGICLDPNTDELPYYRETLPLFEKYGLKSMVNLFPRRVSDMRPLLEFAREVNAVKVNTIAQVMPVSVAGAVPLISRWLDEAQGMGIELLFETHRNGILNDLYFTSKCSTPFPNCSSPPTFRTSWSTGNFRCPSARATKDSSSAFTNAPTACRAALPRPSKCKSRSTSRNTRPGSSSSKSGGNKAWPAGACAMRRMRPACFSVSLGRRPMRLPAAMA